MAQEKRNNIGKKLNHLDLSQEEQRIAQLLLKYLETHPEVKHSAEGIARWWILEQKLEEEVGVVKNVIKYFKEVGFLEEVKIPTGETYFKFNPEKIKKMQNKE